MKKSGHVSSRLVLAAGAMAALSTLPQSASAQMVGSFIRRGTAAAPQQAEPQPSQAEQSSEPQQAAPVEPPQMRPGPIVRGTVPTYRSAPVPSSAPVYSNGPIYGRGPVVNRPPVYVQSPVYGRGGNNNYGNNTNDSNNDGNGTGSPPDQSYYPPSNDSSNNYYPSNGGSYGQVNLPPIGPANGFFRHPIPPVGPANGFFSGQAPITGGGLPRLGGYYYGNYCNVNAPFNSYRSVYSDYDGFPQYIDSPNVIILDNSYNPVYATPYLPFYPPVYQTTYNQNNYYVATEGRVQQLQAGGAQAKEALQHAYPANSFQAAFADIAHAWTDDDIDLVRQHLRDPDTRISVFLNGKYQYSIASSDYSQITRDALDRLHTVSFNFTRLRKTKNGDVTAYGRHIYRVSDTSGNSDTGTVPFDQSGADPNSNANTSASPYDPSADPALGAEKTVYVSYTLRRYAGEWDIIAMNSADHDLAKAKNKAAE